MRNMNESVEPSPTAPVVCPFCNAATIETTSKAITVSTYWRCLKCGEIWNVSRLRATHGRNTYRW